MEMREPSVSYRTSDPFKQTEVGLIPHDWTVKPAKQLGEPVRGSSPRPAGDPRFFNGDFVPWLTVASLTNVPQSQLVISETATSLTEEGANYSRTLQPGTLIISNSGATLGVAKILGMKCCANDGIAALLRLDREICPEYLAHFINTQTKKLREVVATGNGQPNLNTRLIGELKFPLPPTFSEQKAIAKALSDVDALIESLSLLLAKKRQIKQGAMQELLTGKRRLPGFSGEWECKRLGEFAEIKKGQLITTEKLVPGDIPVIAGGKKPAYFHSTANRWGTTITVSASGASAGYVTLHRSSIFASDCSTISESDAYCIDFLFYALLARQEEIYATQTGGAQPHVQPKDLARLRVLLPREIDEQTAIADAISDIDAELEALERRVLKVRDIKSGMMQELLTGRIRLVQPASNVIPLPAKPAATNPPPAQPAHNWQINEAVVIGVLAKRFGTEKFPLPRKRRVKLMYLLHRHVEGRAEGYLKKAAGPYDPNTKYKGPEAIALKNGYVRALNNGKYEGFVAGDKAEQALVYFEQWYGTAVLEWLERFHYCKTEDLELLATVDMAMMDLAAAGQFADVAGVKHVIATHPEWVPKLSRELFSEEKIARAISECQSLFDN